MFDEVPNIRLNRRSLKFTPRGVDWIPYTIAPNAVAIQIFAVGGGGGGGRGFTGIAGAARGGGGGGGGGGIFRAVLPTILLPDTLFLQPGAGGLTTVAGGASIIGLRASNGTTTNIYTVGGGGTGGTGTGAAAGAAGSGGVIGTNGMFSDYGPFLSVAGGAGVAGGTPTTAGTSVTPTRVCNGGAGGAGCTGADLAGGNVTATGFFPLISGGGVSGGEGFSGLTSWKPFFASGGSGAGSFNAGVGGKGGPGGVGSGGGGGGGGTTGGDGGRGGDGVIFITEIF